MQGFEDYNTRIFKTHDEKMQYLQSNFPTIVFFTEKSKVVKEGCVSSVTKMRNCPFTINNYTSADIERLDNFTCKFLCYSFEVGEEGTPHIQGYMQLDEQPRFSKLQKEISRNIWVPPFTKGDPYDNMKYIFGGFPVVNKGNAIKEKNNPSLIFVRGKIKNTPTQTLREYEDMLKTDIQKGLSRDEIFSKYPGSYLRYKNNIDSLIQHYTNERIKKEKAQQFKDYELREFEISICEIIEAPVNPRKFYWIYETEGNLGKSRLVNYLTSQIKLFEIGAASVADMLHIIVNQQYDGSAPVFIDLPRLYDQKFIYSIYNIIEQMLNGKIFASKYNSQVIHAHVPHIFIFSNEAPPLYNENKKLLLSIDRFEVFRVNHQCQLIKEPQELLYNETQFIYPSDVPKKQFTFTKYKL